MPTDLGAVERRRGRTKKRHMVRREAREGGRLVGYAAEASHPGSLVIVGEENAVGKAAIVNHVVR